MKNIIHFLSLFIFALFFGCSALKNNTINVPINIQANIDLVNLDDDKVQISVSPSKVEKDEIIFIYPKLFLAHTSIQILGDSLKI